MLLCYFLSFRLALEICETNLCVLDSGEVQKNIQFLEYANRKGICCVSLFAWNLHQVKSLRQKNTTMTYLTRNLLLFSQVCSRAAFNLTILHHYHGNAQAACLAIASGKKSTIAKLAHIDNKHSAFHSTFHRWHAANSILLIMT